METETPSPSASLGPFLDAAPVALDRTAGWRYLRDQGDVYERDGVWFITSAELIRAAERNTAVFSTAKAFENLGSPVPLIPLATDPPEHTRYRRVLDPLFAPRNVSKLESGMREYLGELIDRFVDDGQCDLMPALATPFPSYVFMTVFGLPLEDMDRFLDWSHRIMHGIGIGEDASTKSAGAELNEYLKEIVARKRQHPGDDILSSVVMLEGERAWSEIEILGMCQLFVTAGLDTVTSVIGFMFMHLAQRPELRARVLADPTIIPSVVEEFLRLELPAPINPRQTTEDVELSGVTIPKGATVLLAMGAANRGDEYGTSKDELDLQLAGQPHLAFGSGVHRCVGMHLARMELRLVIEEFHRRIPDYSLAAGHQPRILWPSLVFVLPELPLTWTPR